MKRPLLALAALAGCVDASRPVTRAAARAVVQERARDEAADRARRAALLPIPMVQREMPRLVAREGTTTHLVAGPLRYDLRDDGVSPAEDVPTEAITGAARGARGWVFVAGAAVYASETFTGRLRLLRSFGCEPSPAEAHNHRDLPVTLPPSVGRVAIAALAHGAFWSDGATLEPLGVPGALYSAWRDPSHGVALVAHRAPQVTVDGGRTWREVGTAGETAMLVEARADALLVATERGARRVDEGTLSLTPTTLPERPCEARAATEPPFERGYERLPPPPPAEACERQRARLRDGWSEMTFDVALEGARRNETNGYGEVTWGFARAQAAPFGPLWARALVESWMAPAVVQVTARATTRGYNGGILWRGRNAAGPFRVAARVRQPREAPPQTRWELLAATRRGALLQLDALPAGQTYAEERTGDALVSPALFWATTAGLRRVEGPSRLGDVWGAIPTDDGGVVLLGADLVTFSEPCDPQIPVGWGRTMSYAVHVGPDGAFRGERVAPDSAATFASIGVGQRGDRWGLVAAERAAPGNLQWLPFDGGREDFGVWRLDATPRVCGAPAGEVTRLHLAFTDDDRVERIFLGTREVERRESLASVRHVVLERDASGVCVRRVAGVHRAGDFEVSPENFHTAHGALILDANAGRLSGIWDDGTRVATVTATLAPPPPPPHPSP